MSVWRSKSGGFDAGSGVLFNRPAPIAQLALAEGTPQAQAPSSGQHRLAFICVYMLTLVMYLRPQELIPGVFGVLPLAKLFAVSGILIFVYSKLSAGEKIVNWPLELKLMSAMWVLGILLMPIAVSKSDSFSVLFDPLIKILLVFILLIHLVNSRSRFRLLMIAMVAAAFYYSTDLIKAYLTGEFGDHRVRGSSEMFANSNDIACIIASLLPFALILGLTSRGIWRWFYLATVGIASFGVLVTFSRSGFLSLAVCGGLIAWKLSRGNRLKFVLAAIVAMVVIVAVMPGSYRARLSTIINLEKDETGSALGRKETAIHALGVVSRRAIVGVGVGNFHIFSIRELRAHNAYLEIAAELGLVGLLIYLLIIFAPFNSLRKIEIETRRGGPRPDYEKYVISVCLQGALLAQVVYSFFGSIQYDFYLYFIVAYAVALRSIHTNEKLQAVTGTDTAGSLNINEQPAIAKGRLWRDFQNRSPWFGRRQPAMRLKR